MKIETRDMTQIALFTAMLSIASIFAIPIGPVPVTLQVFFFLLIPALLGSVKGTLSIALYMLIGLIGMPVFAGGSGGLQSVLSPSFGYIIGAVALAPIIGQFGRKDVPLFKMVGIMTLAILLLYGFGMSYQYIMMNNVHGTDITMRSILIGNITTFLPIDILKAIGAATVYDRLRAIQAVRA